MIKETLIPYKRDDKVVHNVFISVSGSSEPFYTRSIENGKVIYSHESGYGYLSADEVQILCRGSDWPH